MAYKSMEQNVAQIGPTVEIVEQIVLFITLRRRLKYNDERRC